MLEVLMMTMGKLVIGLNDWPTRTASNLQQSHLDLTSCQHFTGVFSELYISFRLHCVGQFRWLMF